MQRGQRHSLRPSDTVWHRSLRAQVVPDGIQSHNRERIRRHGHEIRCRCQLCGSDRAHGIPLARSGAHGASAARQAMHQRRRRDTPRQIGDWSRAYPCRHRLPAQRGGCGQPAHIIRALTGRRQPTVHPGAAHGWCARHNKYCTLAAWRAERVCGMIEVRSGCMRAPWNGNTMTTQTGVLAPACSRIAA